MKLDQIGLERSVTWICPSYPPYPGFSSPIQWERLRGLRGRKIWNWRRRNFCCRSAGTDGNQRDSKDVLADLKRELECTFFRAHSWTKFSRANIFFLDSASNIVPPIPPLVRKLDTILISVAVRLLAPPLFFYIPLCVFPFRAVRPTVVVKISTMFI